MRAAAPVGATVSQQIMVSVEPVVVVAHQPRQPARQILAEAVQAAAMAAPA
jgi:hypothetical protein